MDERICNNIMEIVLLIPYSPKVIRLKSRVIKILNITLVTSMFGQNIKGRSFLFYRISEAPYLPYVIRV
jgi:hypothetical protein